MLLLDAVPRLRNVLPHGAAATVERILRASGAVPARHIDMMRSPATLRFYELAEQVTGKGQLLWFGIRKRWVAECVEEAIRDGARQLLVLGSGLDPLAAMVAERHPDVLCAEIDAPATANPKASGIRGAGLERPNLVVIPIDLSQTPLVDALQKTPWSKDAPSVVVAEGLLMYLTPADVDAFFRALSDCTAPGTRVAFTVMDMDEQGRPYLGPLSGMMRPLLRLIGEPLQWALRPHDVPAYLEARGFRLRDQPSMDELRQRLLEPIGGKDEPLSHYDYLVLAELNEGAADGRAADH